MAIYHFNAKTIGRSQGRSATGAAAYRAGVRIVDERTGLVFDFTRKRGVDGSEILTPDGSNPDRAALWNAVERSEKRIDAQVAREIEIALPRELTPDEMREAVRSFVREQFVALGMVADIAFHHLTGSNPHAHILLTLREWGSQGFGLKRREWNEHALCLQWRERWAEHANEALARAGHEIRIDHRTLTEQAAEAAEQGRHADAIALDRAPTVHERGNPTAHAHNVRVRHANEVRRANSEGTTQTVDENGATAPTKQATPRKRARTEALAVAEAAFLARMSERRDLTAATWRMYDRRAKAAAEWLQAHAGEEARRLEKRDRAAARLREARATRTTWLAENPRPFWPWNWKRWETQKACYQKSVSAAKRFVARADERASPKEIALWQQEYEARRAEHAEALEARKTLAATPSERAARWRERTEQTAARNQEQMPQPAATIEASTTERPRPRMRPR